MKLIADLGKHRFASDLSQGDKSCERHRSGNPEVPEEHVTRRRRLDTPPAPSENVEPDGDAAMTGER